MRISKKIALGYFVVGVVYIALSDVLLSLYHGRDVIENFGIVSQSILKGWTFITVTAILLYLVMSRYISHLQEQRTLRDMVVNNTRDMLWMVDSKLDILLANNTFVNTLNKKSESALLGRSVLEFSLDDDDREKWKGYYNRALGGDSFHSEESFGGDDGKILEFDFHFYPVRNTKGLIDKVACFGHDITELKRYQAEIVGQNEALKEITWIQSHELRKPLANIQGIVQAIDADNLNNPENSDLLKHLHEEANKLDGVIRKVVEKATTRN